MAQYTPLFYRGAPASIPQVVAHLQRAMTEEDPEYTPLRQRMPPASIPDIVAHIQQYLTENAFVTMEDLGTSIAQYIEDHPDIVGVASINGSTGDVTLDAGDIPVETGEDPTVAGAISYLSSQIALLVADAVMSINNVLPDDSHNVTLTGADIAQDANTTKKLSETFGAATSSTAGTKGLVPAPAPGDQDKVLSGAGTWVNQSTGTVQQVCGVSPNAQGNVSLTGSAVPTSTTDNTPIATTLSSLNDQIAYYSDLPISQLTNWNANIERYDGGITVLNLKNSHKLVVINLTLRAINNIAGYAVLFNMPVGFIPANSLHFAVLDNNVIVRVGNLYSTGSCSVSQAINQNEHIYYSIVYMV